MIQQSEHQLPLPLQAPIPEKPLYLDDFWRAAIAKRAARRQSEQRKARAK
ncbi:MAG: hypothetical protein JWM78_455 [Verrucomicrobiaceae bacterium]|nr:hypothetical protein [Verrucomicrobiaceae bacterium]